MRFQRVGAGESTKVLTFFDRYLQFNTKLQPYRKTWVGRGKGRRSVVQARNAVSADPCVHAIVYCLYFSLENS